MTIPFGNLKRHYEMYHHEFDAAIKSVLDSGWFVLGKAGEQFEQEFADYCNAKFAIGVGSGTDAIHLSLLALGVGAGDEVITVANTCVPTVSAISVTGARPILVDVDSDSFTMSATDLEKRITKRTKAIVPVHMYGQSADIDRIAEVAGRFKIPIVEDAAQAHGTKYKDRKIGSISPLTCFSFYPSKNLGCFGDGGCVTTSDDEIANRLRMLRNYGQRERYYHSIKGVNSRLDEIQAAVLSVKLRYLDRWNDRRRSIARFYRENISSPFVYHPNEMGYGRHIFHLYVIRVQNRIELQKILHESNIGTMIHYPVPIHLQESYKELGYAKGEFPVSEMLGETVMSLPMYPELTDEEVSRVCEQMNILK
jgi:dTDP-4-amino-4,6-dideoxygalactose transaminase